MCIGYLLGKHFTQPKYPELFHSFNTDYSPQ